MPIAREALDSIDFAEVVEPNGAPIPPAHPGEVLLEEFMRPLGLSQYRLAKAILVPALRISLIVRRQRSMTADTALRLARYFGTTPEFWLNLQNHYDLAMARRHTLLDQITPRLAA